MTKNRASPFRFLLSLALLQVLIAHGLDQHLEGGAAAAAVRLDAPSLERTLLTWNLTTSAPNACPGLKTKSPNPAA